MTYHNAIKYIKNAPDVAPTDQSAKERINLLFNALSNPQKKTKYVRLAGSNGKSVYAQMITSGLNCAGITSGYVTMQILSDFRENVKINGNPLSIDEIVKFTEIVILATAKINAASKEKNPGSNVTFVPTIHEIILCIAMIAFAEKCCKLVFIESDHNTGDPSLYLPTPISIVICGSIPSDDDEIRKIIHSYLQKGINEIVSVPQNNTALNLITKHCQKINCRLTMSTPARASILSTNLRGTKFTYDKIEYTLKICGKFQVGNAILAIESLKMLNRNNYCITEKNLIDGLAKTTLPSKFEVISISPTIIIDSTHTPIAIKMVTASLAELKSFTGNKVRLCLTDVELCDYYKEALLKKGYEIESIIAVSQGESSATTQDGDAILLRKIPKQAAKLALANLTEDTLLLVSGRSDIAEKIRYEICSALAFK